MWILGDFVPPGSGRCWKRRIDICICYLLVHQYNCGVGAGGHVWQDSTIEALSGFLQGGVSGYRVHVLIFTPPSNNNKKGTKEVSDYDFKIIKSKFWGQLVFLCTFTSSSSDVKPCSTQIFFLQVLNLISRCHFQSEFPLKLCLKRRHLKACRGRVFLLNIFISDVKIFCYANKRC